MQLYLNFERLLVEEEVNRFRELIKRRGQREPLQHIIGSTSFCGLEIAVNRNVLVPRQETELLAERGWQFLNQISTGQSREGSGESLTAVDFGTGSGCLAIALAERSAASQLYAIDASEQALQVARQNAARFAGGERIHFLLGESLQALPVGRIFNLIISNPPYIPTAEIDALQVEVREFDPRQALDGGADGLDFYRLLAREAGERLRANGKIMVEFGEGQAKSLANIFESENWVVEEIMEDYTHRPRILIARRLE
jgi:release factor glutamine methyltransferase